MILVNLSAKFAVTKILNTLVIKAENHIAGSALHSVDKKRQEIMCNSIVQNGL